MPKSIFRNTLRSGFLILAGIIAAAFGLHGFLLPGGFVDGGVTGISMLLSRLLGVELYKLILLINLPFLLLGYFQLGKAFTFRSVCAIFGLSACLAFVHFPSITADKLLVAVFGGMFLGAGIGLAIRGGAVLDGTEIFALLISKRFSKAVGDVILFLNIIIFSCAAYFLDLETALYSVLTYYSASRTIDFLVYGLEEYCGVTIISNRSNEVRTALIQTLGRGITRYNGRGGMTDEEKDILFSVVTRIELSRLKRVVEEIDEKAFLVVHQLSDVRGGVLARRALDRLKKA